MPNPVTTEQANAVIAQIDLVKKKRGSRWECRDLEIYLNGGASVTAKFNVLPVTVSSWFRQATANVYRTLDVGNGWTRIYFDMLPVKAERNNDPDFWELC